MQHMMTVTAVRSGERFYLGYSVDFANRLTLRVHYTPIQISKRYALRVAAAAEADEQFSDVVIADGEQQLG